MGFVAPVHCQPAQWLLCLGHTKTHQFVAGCREDFPRCEKPVRQYLKAFALKKKNNLRVRFPPSEVSNRCGRQFVVKAVKRRLAGGEEMLQWVAKGIFERILYTN